MTMSTSEYALTDEQRQKLIERHRRELPRFDREYEEAMARICRYTKDVRRRSG